MANVIQLKRNVYNGSSAGAPASLVAGELAYDGPGNTLHR